MIENKNIDELLSKYFSGNSLPEEAMFVYEWKEESNENRLYFENSEKIFYGKAKEIDVHQAWSKVQDKINQSSRRANSFVSVWRIAASVIVLFGLSAAIYFLMNRNNAPVHYIAEASVVKAVLSDGTDIQLSPHSQLTLAYDFGKNSRTLSLKGSAYFSVKHEEARPFVVNVEGVFVKDLGTKFLIRTSSDTDTIYVRVDEGVVLLFDSLHSQVEIKAGASAMYVKSIGKIIANEAASVPRVELSFDSSTLAQAVKQLSADYHVKIEIANPSLNGCVFTSQFKNEKLETILSVITETLNITYTKTETGYIISGEHCTQ